MQNSARGLTAAAVTEKETGLTDQQWWDAAAPFLMTVFDPARYPVAARVGGAVGEAYQSSVSPEHSFEFGLETDEGFPRLADVRVVTGSGRDTLTDERGYFMIGDLPPGEHILLLDEKTIPEQTKSVAGSKTVTVAAGNETAIVFPVAKLPDQIKRFPGN